MKNHKIIKGSVILNNENNFQIGQNSETPETYAAKLAFIGTALSTSGDGVQTIAAGIALQELQNANNQNSQSQLDQSKEFERMQRQINKLTSQVDQLTSQMARMNRKMR